MGMIRIGVDEHGLGVNEHEVEWGMVQHYHWDVMDWGVVEHQDEHKVEWGMVHHQGEH